MGRTFFRVVTIHAFDRRRTDRRTDGFLVTIPCVTLHRVALEQSGASIPQQPSPFSPLTSLPLSPPLTFLLILPYRRPFKSSQGPGEARCKVAQWGLGRSPSRDRIWCILALKYDIWWQQFQWFSSESIYQISCSLQVSRHIGTMEYHALLCSMQIFFSFSLLWI